MTVALCFLVAMMEGLDLQAPGIAALGMGEALKLDKLALGEIFSVGILGLLPGAAIGGWLSDRIGRKWVLIVAVALFGACSLLTALAWDYWSLWVFRLMTGIGLGAALPNLIAVSAEAVSAEFRNRAVAIMYAGVPAGAIFAALIGIAGFTGADGSWKMVFWVGGIVPLLIVPLLVARLNESASLAGNVVAGGTRVGVADGLFRQRAWTSTLLLWVSYFFTLMVVYILIQWLPMLLRDLGFSKAQASWTVFWMHIGSTTGTLLLGWLTDRLQPWSITVLIYGGILSALAGLGFAAGFMPMVLAAVVAGFFAVGGQGVLYAMAPWCYRTEVRATGVGAAVAVGRLGAMSGPLVAGKVLAMGGGAVGVLLGTMPGVALAAASMFMLSARIKRG
jgi:AAHS family 3-hydroxyphenylpropionic acid transporter